MIYLSEEQVAQTPSRKVGVNSAKELAVRQEDARHIATVGRALQIPVPVIYTAVYLMHRLYTYISVRDVDHLMVAGACVLLAGKIEEFQRKSDRIVTVVSELRSKLEGRQIVLQSFEAKQMKDDLLRYERVLLKAINFDLHVEQPYSMVLSLAKTLPTDDGVSKENRQKVAQKAWELVNDSIYQPMCLRFTPMTIAIGCLQLAMQTVLDKPPAQVMGSEMWWGDHDDKVKAEDVSVVVDMLSQYRTSQ
eukprot:Clim_evm54s150 gene=Clim_evmTU54s150